jgi:hypothetical protein
VSQDRQDQPEVPEAREEQAELDRLVGQGIWDLRVSLVPQALLEAQGELVLPEVLAAREGRVDKEIKESLELQVHRVETPGRSIT